MLNLFSVWELSLLEKKFDAVDSLKLYFSGIANQPSRTVTYVLNNHSPPVYSQFYPFYIKIVIFF